MQKKTIGFFGDSFCANKSKDTYISMLAQHYNANIVNLGVGGCSVIDTVLLQLNPFIKSGQVPDICVFVWTNPGRLYHQTIRNINHATALSSTSSDPVWLAAKEYYTHLYDHNQIELEYVSVLEHVDNKILPLVPTGTKIVHLWAFGSFKKFTDEYLAADKLSYHHTWTNGVEVRPALISISLQDSSVENFILDYGPNHLTTQKKNDLVFELIKTAIDQQ